MADADTPQNQAEPGPLHQLLPEGAIRGGVPFRLYYLAAATGATGSLAFRSPDGATFELYFRKGNPELARSTAPGLDLGSFLVRKGVLDPAGLVRAEAARESHGGELVRAILALGHIAPTQVFPLLAEHSRSMLDRALALEEGSFRWDPEATPPSSAFPLGGKWDLLCDAGRRLEPATVRRRLGGRIDRPVMQAGDGLAKLDDLRLTAQERGIAASFDGTRTLAERAAANPAQAETILRTAFFLAEVGLASFAAGPPVTPPPPPARKPATPTPVSVHGTSNRPAPGGVAMPAAPPVLRPVGAPAAPPPLPAARSMAAEPQNPVPAAAPLTPVPAPEPPAASTAPGLPSDLAGVRAFLAGLEGKDHFEVLGLTRSATLTQIKNAYFRMARAFHPDTAGTDSDPALRQVKQDLTARLNEAYQLLSDEGRRSEYLQALASGATSSRVDVAALIAAEERFSEAMRWINSRRFAEALEPLEKAISLNPDEGEFYAWRGWSRFAASQEPDAAAPVAMQDIKRALELSPKCAVAWLFAARIASALGQNGRAADAYRKCLALDARQLEAQRELRLLERGTTR